MLRRRRGGCLSTIIMVTALAIAAFLIYQMVSPGESHGKGNPITSLIDRIRGMGGKSEETVGAGRNTEPKTSPLAELPSRDAIVVELTDEALRGLLQNAADNAFPLTIEKLIISSDATITFMGTMNRQDFIDFVEKSGTVLGSVESFALKLAPKSMDFTVITGVDFDPPTGKVRLDPQKLTVSGLNIPTALVPSALNDKLNTALTDFFASYGHAPVGLALFDGYMKVYFE